MQIDQNAQTDDVLVAGSDGGFSVDSGDESPAPPGVSPEAIDETMFRSILTRFRDALNDHRSRINDLNVYPVPDGDTGTNMSFTMQSVIKELEASEAGLEPACAAVAHGALMGARGNSGVIMAQILRGITSVLRSAVADGTPLDGNVLAKALSAASDGAYGAVGNPVEGTILTVIREASEAAREAAAADSSLGGVFDAAHSRGYDALARTPEMLAVLAEAGVVDAGGSGLMLFIDAGRAEIGGHLMPVPADSHAAPPGTTASASQITDGDSGEATESSIADLRYEVMYLLDADDSEINGFKTAWAEIGDSIVVVGGEGMWNCHVHTDDIGAAIEAGIAVGRPHRIRVTDLLEEVAERDWVRNHLEESADESAQSEHEPVDETPLEQVEITEPDRCSIVAVGAGAGVVAMFESLGVHRVVAGGQSMNPSTADLLAAVDSLPTGHVVVLPNNSNIIPVAKQLDDLTDRSVGVVPTKSVIAGIEAVMGFTADADSGCNRAAMAEAASGVVAGQITQAVRDAVSPAGPINTGDWLGIGPDGISVVAPDEAAAATGLLAKLVTDDHDLLTVITGAEAEQSAIDAISRYAEQCHHDLEVEVRDGGQPLYPYYFGLE